MAGFIAGLSNSWGKQYRNLSLHVGGPELKQWNTSPAGLKTEKDCAGEAQQQLKTAGATSRQRGCPTLTNPQLTRNHFKKEKNWLRIPDGCLTPGQTGLLPVSRKLTSTSTLLRRIIAKSKSKSHYERKSVGQSVLVSGAHLGPATNFSISLRFYFRQLLFVIL
jgi:hypothetical protein